MAPPYIVEPLQNHEPLIQSMKIFKKKKKANPNFIKKKENKKTNEKRKRKIENSQDRETKLIPTR